jgi:hypothetical protein
VRLLVLFTRVTFVLFNRGQHRTICVLQLLAKRLSHHPSNASRGKDQVERLKPIFCAVLWDYDQTLQNYAVGSGLRYEFHLVLWIHEKWQIIKVIPLRHQKKVCRFTGLRITRTINVSFTWKFLLRYALNKNYSTRNKYKLFSIFFGVSEFSNICCLSPQFFGVSEFSNACCLSPQFFWCFRIFEHLLLKSTIFFVFQNFRTSAA